MDDLEHDCAFREALEASRDMVLVKGPESRLLWANRSFREYYQMTAAELLGIIDGPQSDPDDTLQYVRDDRMVFETADHVDIASEAVTDAAGVVRYFHTVKSPIVRDGDVVRSVGISRMLDDAEVITHGLSHADAKALTKPLRVLTTAFPIAVAMTDVHGHVVSISPKWKARFGDLPVQGPTRLRDIDAGLEPADAPLGRALGSGESSAVEIRVDVGADERTFEVRVGPWRYDDGSLGGALLLTIDVTEEAQRKAELLSTVNKQLEAERLLREINDDLEHFVHIAAHDLREPARRQLMLIDLLVDEYDEELDDAIVDQLDRIRGQSRKMLAMIDGFRHLSDIAGPSIELTDVEVRTLVDELLADLVPVDADDVSVVVDVPSTVRGYPSLLRALFSNLITNALHHGPRPLDLRIVRETVGDRSEFSVSSDLVTEVSPAESVNLFKPFVGDSATGGTGLGLSICKRVVERHKGRIWLDTDDRFDVRFTLGERQ